MNGPPGISCVPPMENSFPIFRFYFAAVIGQRSQRCKLPTYPFQYNVGRMFWQKRFFEILSCPYKEPRCKSQTIIKKNCNFFGSSNEFFKKNTVWALLFKSCRDRYIRSLQIK